MTIKIKHIEHGMIIHKNLMLQLQYNYVHSKLSADNKHSELWGELYFRF